MALTLAVPLSAGAPLVPDALNGSGTAITFQVFGAGFALEGGAYAWNDVCGRCQILISVRDGTFVLSDSANAATTLPPGVYELREFRGLFHFTPVARHQFDVELHGLGKVERLG